MVLLRPIVFFDIESTGLDREHDRIVEFSATKIHVDGIWETRTKRINPSILIPAESTAIHGITNEMVADCPSFMKISNSLLSFITGCDLGVYGGISFDVPMLYNEFQRVGIKWDYHAHNIIDSGNIFKIQEPRDLTAAVNYYCNETFDDAHGAEADAIATAKVFFEQMGMYPILDEMNMEQLAEYSNYGKKILDVSGKFTYNEQGVIVLNFGKHRDQPAADHKDFLQWMLSKDFPPDTVEVCNKVIRMEGEQGRFN